LQPINIQIINVWVASHNSYFKEYRKMSDNSQFTEREKEVMEFLLQGKSNKQIALALGVSASTVEYHLNNIYKKLQVNSRTEAVLRLGKSIGRHITGELGKSSVEMNGDTTDNGVQPVSTRRIPLNKMFVIISGGLLTIALVVVLVLALVLVNISAQSPKIEPTNFSPLPDLTITSAYVSMVDNNGICLPYYGFNVTVVNQGIAPAHDVLLADNTGQEVGVGDLSPLQSMSMSFVAKAVEGGFTVAADPHNKIVESNENNNITTFSDATATPVVSCLPMQFGDGTPTPGSTTYPVQVWPTATPQVMPAANDPTLSKDVLRNGRYNSSDWGAFQLSNGIYYRTPPNVQESADTYTTHLLDTILYGDINLDGLEDAIVFFSTQNGGTGHLVEMAAVLNLNGTPSNISTLSLGDRVIVESGTVQGRWISLNLRVPGPNDAACCASQSAIRIFHFDGNQLIERTP
jgi:DNA-binding CsgD family transcriptional regulator